MHTIFKSLTVIAVLSFATPTFTANAQAAPKKTQVCKSKKSGKVVKCPAKSAKAKSKSDVSVPTHAPDGRPYTAEERRIMEAEARMMKLNGGFIF